MTTERAVYRSGRRAPSTPPVGPLTPAQQRELLAALKVHPAVHSAGSKAVGRRLQTAGMLSETGDGLALTTSGLSHATEIAAKLLIARTGSARGAASPIEQAGSGAGSARVVGRPPAWPFQLQESAE